MYDDVCWVHTDNGYVFLSTQYITHTMQACVALVIMANPGAGVGQNLAQPPAANLANGSASAAGSVDNGKRVRTFFQGVWNLTTTAMEAAGDKLTQQSQQRTGQAVVHDSQYNHVLNKLTALEQRVGSAYAGSGQYDNAPAVQPVVPSRSVMPMLQDDAAHVHNLNHELRNKQKQITEQRNVIEEQRNVIQTQTCQLAQLQQELVATQEMLKTRPPPQQKAWEVGDHVWAWWKGVGEGFHRATVVGFMPDGMVTIQWDDNAEGQTIHATNCISRILDSHEDVATRTNKRAKLVKKSPSQSQKESFVITVLGADNQLLPYESLVKQSKAPGFKEALYEALTVQYKERLPPLNHRDVTINALLEVAKRQSV